MRDLGVKISVTVMSGTMAKFFSTLILEATILHTMVVQDNATLPA